MQVEMKNYTASTYTSKIIKNQHTGVSQYADFLLFFQFFEKARHFECIHRTFEAFVAGLEAGAVDGLLDGIRGEDTVEDGDTAGEGGHSDAFRDFGRYVFVVVSLSADDSAKADDGIIFAAFCHFLRRERDLEGARHPREVDFVHVEAMTGETIGCAVDKFGNDDFIETGGDDADADIAFIEKSGNDVHEGISFGYM